MSTPVSEHQNERTRWRGGVLRLVLGGALIVVSIRGIEPCHQLFCGFLQ